MSEFLVVDEQVVRRRTQPLVVGAAHDPAEHEADAVAEATVQRLAEQDADAAAPAHVHPVPAGRVHRSAHAAHDEFEAPVEVDRRIRRATGTGRPLDADVRRRFEGATGRDLGNVRVHVDSEADRLSTAVSAKAFTTGDDIFFSGGSFRPDTRAGQHLLAHELAHTAQQGGSVQRTIRRFTLDDADFTRTQSVNVIQKGGSGNVALFHDGSGRPLVVKVDQLIGNEVAVAGQLHEATAARNGGSGGYSVTTPHTRLARPAERAVIKQATLARLEPDQEPRNFVTGLDSDKPVVIMEQGSGVDFSEAIATTAHTRKGRLGKTVANEDSILFRLTKDAGPLTTLAQQLPVDVVMGMFDRLISIYNPDNFMYDEATQSFGYVDNTQNGPQGFLTSVDIEGMVIGHRESFDAWSSHWHVTNLATDPAKLAQAMFDTTIGERGGRTGMRHELPDQPGLPALFEAALAKNGAKMLGWMKAGIDQGKDTVLSLLTNPLPLVAGIPDDRKQEAVQSLLARKYFLSGMAADKAWVGAGVTAQRLLNPRVAPIEQAPQRPTGGPPQDGPGDAPQRPTTTPPPSPRGRQRANAVGAHG